MRLKTLPVPLKYEFGDIKTTRKYAWWPKRVENALIWLEHYELLEKKSARPRIIMAGHVPLIAPWGWDFVAEKLINKNTCKK